MTNENDQNSKPKYDLEERTFEFAKRVRMFVKNLPKLFLTEKIADKWSDQAAQ
jgi:hypothetical protein